MSDDEYIDKFEELSKMGDPEIVHGMADDLLLQYVEERGSPQISDAWRQVRNIIGFWYA